MSDERILLKRTQCPECFSDMELVGLMDEARWDAMTVQQRVNLCTMADITPRHGSKSYEELAKLTDKELAALCDYRCVTCFTDWPVEELLKATQTRHQVDVYLRQQGRD